MRPGMAAVDAQKGGSKRSMNRIRAWCRESGAPAAYSALGVHAKECEASDNGTCTGFVLYGEIDMYREQPPSHIHHPGVIGRWPVVLAAAALPFAIGGLPGCATTGGQAPPAASQPSAPQVAHTGAEQQQGVKAPTQAPRVSLANPGTSMTIGRPSLYPETLAVNPATGRFLVSSVREGGVYEIGPDGSARQVVADERLTSVLGIAVDAENNRLWVTNSDLGAGLRPSERGVGKEAGVGLYELSSGKRLFYAELSDLRPDQRHLINGMTLDADGNAYVTDSFAAAIYKVTPTGDTSVFLANGAFEGEGINLNGLVVHPDGFMLVVKKSDGTLFRIPLDAPEDFQRVQLDERLGGGDGLLLVGKDELVVVANQVPDMVSNRAFSVRTTDGWVSATVDGSVDLGDVYPTTCTERDGKVYVLSSHLNEWIGADANAKAAVAQRQRKAVIEEIGKVAQ